MTAERVPAPKITTHLEPEKIYLTEKLDGTNVRLIFINNTYFIGSREELLHHRGDLVYNNSLGIVDAVRHLADKIFARLSRDFLPFVLYGELYGNKIGSQWKNYDPGFSVFDTINLCQKMFKTPAEAALWRDSGGQSFLRMRFLRQWMEKLNIDTVPIVGVASILPETLEDTYKYLENYRKTNRGPGKAEGLVIRNEDRSFIAKLRFEDYERTLCSTRK